MTQKALSLALILETDKQNNNENQEVNQKETVELYSQRAISIATYVGEPLAAGILARQNFINLGKEQLGKNALIIGIISTVLLFAVIFSVPEEIITKVPKALIPLIYTGLIYLIIEKYQGTELKAHKENKKPFYSAWKATGIGVVCMLILLGGIFGYAFLSPDDFDAKTFNNGIAEFKRNEEKALQLFSIIEYSSSDKVINHIDIVGIPAWEQNLKLLNELDNIEGLYDQFKKQNEILRQYSNLRIETFELIKKTVLENTDKYDERIGELNQQIEEILKKM